MRALSAVVLASLLLALASAERSQAEPPPGTAAGAVDASRTCPPGISFQAAGYVVRSVRVEHPFRFLPWIHAAITESEREMATMVGKPYRLEEVSRWIDALDHRTFLPDAIEQRVGVSAVVVRLEHCAEGALDVVYYDFSTQVAPSLDGTFESERAATAAPQNAAGAANTRAHVRMAPSLGYDRDEGGFGGGHIEYRPAAGGGAHLVDSLTIDGQGSPFMHRVSAGLEGSSDTIGPDWMADAHWQLDYSDVFEPADAFRLERRRGLGAVNAVTRPLGGLEVPLRFGALVEGGEQSSDFATQALPSDTVRRSSYWSSKVYVGSSARLDRSSFNVSYGLEVGARGTADVDWIKHIGDVAHQASVPIPGTDHRALDVESHLTGGLLQVPGEIPTSVRFFGGNREEPFIPGQAWSIRSNPVIRSIPANGFFRTKHGPGGTWFASYNLTLAAPIWRKPLVPPELTRAPDFKEQIAGVIGTATSTLQVEYSTRDASYARTTARLGDVARVLTDLAAAVDAARGHAGGDHADLFTGCSKAIKSAQFRTKKASEEKGAQQLGSVKNLLDLDAEDDDDEDGAAGTGNRMSKVQLACIQELNATVHDPAIASRAADFEAIRRDMERSYAAIDQAAATRQAESEMAFVRRVIDQLLDECNIFAISPVLMFDVAQIGPSASRYGTRFGVGGGLRLTLVNSVDFTAGYVANPTARSNEDPGAPFLAIQFKDFFF